ASAMRAATSLASTTKLCSRMSGSDGDIHGSVTLHDFKFLQPQVRVAYVGAVGEMERIAVPRTDDVGVAVVEGLPVKDAVLYDRAHRGHAQAFAGGASLMRAQIAVCVILVGLPDDADLQPSGSHDAHRAIGDLSVLADANLRHGPYPSLMGCCW